MGGDEGTTVVSVTSVAVLGATVLAMIGLRPSYRQLGDRKLAKVARKEDKELGKMTDKIEDDKVDNEDKAKKDEATKKTEPHLNEKNSIQKERSSEANFHMEIHNDESTLDDYYITFCILYMIGYLCHNRRYWRQDILWSLGILSAYVIFGSPTNNTKAGVKPSTFRNFIFLTHLIFILLTWIPGWPHGANHKNILGLSALVLLPQQLRRCFWTQNHAQVRDNTEGAFNVIRCTIVMMYFFAGFHKINTDFLFEPTVTCAYEKVYYYIDLVGYGDLEDLPDWINLTVPPVILFIELIPALGLVFNLGNAYVQAVCVANFLLLHLILLPMGFADFGTIAQSFLILFIHPVVLTVRSGLPLHFYFCLAGVFIFFEVVALLRWYLAEEDEEQLYETVCGLVLMGHGIMWASVFLQGLSTGTTAQEKPRTPAPPPVQVHCPKSVAGILTVGFFFFFAMNPYLGLRTAGNLTMFSNLRTEGPTSNHLLLRNNPLKIFTYQEDTVEVLEVDRRWRRLRFGEGDIVPRVLFEMSFQFFCGIHGEHWDDVAMIIRYNSTVMETQDICHDPEWSLFLQERPFWERKFLNMRTIQKEGPQECSW